MQHGCDALYLLFCPTCLGLAAYHAYFTVMMTQNPAKRSGFSPAGVLETALYVDDLVAARQFYTEVLGLEIVTEAEGRHVFFRVGSGMLLVFDPVTTVAPPEPPPALQVPPHGATGPGHICFSVTATGLQQGRKALEKAGIKIESEVEWPNGAVSVYFRDPAGNSLELAEPRLWFSES
jgi:catechol 2,3-dioxygenase-like lactoylglutathione lyase family enzyme